MSQYFSDRDSEAIELQNLKFWSSTYAKEGQRLDNILKEMGCDVNDLSPETQAKLDELVSHAMQLSLNKVTTSSFYGAINDMCTEEHKLEAKNSELTQRITHLNENLVKLNLFYESLAKEYRSIEASLPEQKNKMHQTESENEFIRAKLEKYKSQNERLLKYVSTLDKTLTHESLINEYEIVKKLEEKVEKMKEELNAYRGLPSNISLAKMTIQETREQIKKINQEIDDAFNIY